MKLGTTALVLAGLCLAASLLWSGPASAQNEGPTGKPDQVHDQRFTEFERVPGKTRTRRNPLENDPDAEAAGKKLFEQHCAECHGMAAVGGKKAPSLRAEEVRRATPGALFWILTNGVVRKGMPVWSKLPEPQRWQIVTYLKSLGQQPPEAKP